MLRSLPVHDSKCTESFRISETNIKILVNLGFITTTKEYPSRTLEPPGPMIDINGVEEYPFLNIKSLNGVIATWFISKPENAIVG